MASPPREGWWGATRREYSICIQVHEKINKPILRKNIPGKAKLFGGRYEIRIKNNTCSAASAAFYRNKLCSRLSEDGATKKVLSPADKTQRTRGRRCFLVGRPILLLL